jgi:hypothetical protein
VDHPSQRPAELVVLDVIFPVLDMIPPHDLDLTERGILFPLKSEVGRDGGATMGKVRLLAEGMCEAEGDGTKDSRRESRPFSTNAAHDVSTASSCSSRPSLWSIEVMNRFITGLLSI